MDPLVITPYLTLPPSDLRWRAVRAAGPGGQNVNKVASKVELRFDLEGTVALDPAVKARLRALAKRRLAADGTLAVTSSSHRTQRMNLESARETLRTLIRRALSPPKARRPTQPSRSEKIKRLTQKRQQGEKKRLRQSTAEDG